MNLLFDIGNSTIAWAIEEENSITQSDRFQYDKNDFVSQLEKNITLPVAPAAVLLSCVAGDNIINALKQWTDNHWQTNLWQADVKSHFNQLENSYYDTQQMGVDRWLAMIAAWEKYQKALCIVDCGTAVTIDIINSTGKHLGGYIVPGIEMMQQSLISNTDRIKAVVSGKVDIVCANNTQDAIINGAGLAIISAIDHSVTMYRQKLNDEPVCIMTGGMAEYIQPLLNTRFEHDKDLVLRGLSLIYRMK